MTAQPKDLGDVTADGGPVPEDADPVDASDTVREAMWQELARKNSRGEERVPATLGTAVAILSRDPHWANRIRRNELAGRTHILGDPLTDDSVIDVACWLERHYDTEWPVEKVRNAITWVANANSYHPIREYLAGLPEWDGQPRLDRLLVDYFGVEEDPERAELHAAYGRNLVVALVARAIVPGCKVDDVLTLQGEQGLGKSSGLAALMYDRSWFMDDHIAFEDTKRLVMILRPRWLCEFADFASVKKGDADQVKAFLTQQADRGVPMFGREVQECPRSVVFVATANDRQFLIEAGRRWCVVTVKRPVDVEGIREDRDQLFAEALHLYNTEKRWWLTAELQEQQRSDALEYAVAAPMVDAIREWTTTTKASGAHALEWLWEKIAVPILMTGQGQGEDPPRVPTFSVPDQRAFAGYLRDAGWTRRPLPKTRVKRWYPPDPKVGAAEPMGNPSEEPF